MAAAPTMPQDLEALSTRPGEITASVGVPPGHSSKKLSYAGLFLAFTMLVLGLFALMPVRVFSPYAAGAPSPSQGFSGDDAATRALASVGPSYANHNSDVDFAGNVTLSSAASSEAWHKGVCPDKRLWGNVKLQCDGCKALVNHQSYGSTCDGYCKSQGLQCTGAWEEVNNDCETKSWSECSVPIWGTSDAICECINPCSQTGNSCTDTTCCLDTTDTCFETTFATAMCMPSCTPGVDGTCRGPFEHPLSQARQTWMWPDVACVLSAGEVLVKTEAFRSIYDSDCSRFCKYGAGKAVTPDNFYKLWISVTNPDDPDAEEQTCPGADASRRGVKCYCSFPDRL